MPRIGIDLDGTVTDYLKSAIPFVKEMYGLEPDFSKPVYGIEGVFGFTKETRPSDIKERLYLEKRIFRHLHRLEEDNNLLTSSLVREIPDLKVYFVTARTNHPVIVEDTHHWVSNNTDYFNDVFHVPDMPKADFCTAAGIPVMIEDEVGQILSLAKKGVHVVCMDQPWNIGVENTVAPGQIIRVRGWREAVDAAKEFLL
jgi:uncharacterized HAD superfamily protein